MFPTAEAGDYFNPRFVFVKYELDKVKPEGIEKFKITAYPTFIIMNEKGEELTRILGGASDAASFIKRFEEALQNPISELRKRYEADPAQYGEEYMSALLEAYLKDQALEVLDVVFPNRSIEENFSPKNMKLYQQNVRDLNGTVGHFMLENRDAVAKIIGEDTYSEFINSRYSQTLSSSFFQFTPEKFTQAIEGIQTLSKKYPALNDDFVNFVLKNKKDYQTKQIDKLVKSAIKSLESGSMKSSQNKISLIQSMTHVAASADYKQARPQLIMLAEKMNSLEPKDEPTDNEGKAAKAAMRAMRMNVDYVRFVK